jgi:hypothetical protein
VSLDVYLYATDLDGNQNEVYSANITHNLGRMADAAGMYEAMWRPEEIGATTAGQITDRLRDGLVALRETPVYFRTFNPANGWGSYEGLVRFTEEYLSACTTYPSARIETWR